MVSRFSALNYVGREYIYITTGIYYIVVTASMVVLCPAIATFVTSFSGFSGQMLRQTATSSTNARLEQLQQHQ